MNRTVRRTWFLVALLLGGVLAAAEVRIAVVDLDRVFREYYKSRVAEEAIKMQAENYRSYLTRLNEQFNQLVEEERVAKANALNYALAPEQKQAAQAAAERATALVKGKRAEIELFVKERGADMRRLEAQKRAEIVGEIKAEIERRALAEGFAFVIDSSGKTLNDQPLLLYYPPSSDVTIEVIRELNRTMQKPAKATPAPAAASQQHGDVKP